MKQSTSEAYAEIDTILNFMDYEYIKEIPEKLRNLFKDKKSNNYEVNINPNKPLKEQNLKEESLSILAVLNYNYWCKDESKKEDLIKKYSENEKIYQEKLREKYNPENIFKQETKEVIENVQEEVNLIKPEELKWYQKIFEKILKIFRK